MTDPLLRQRTDLPPFKTININLTVKLYTLSLGDDWDSRSSFDEGCSRLSIKLDFLNNLTNFEEVWKKDFSNN